jgi:hypothetical protein
MQSTVHPRPSARSVPARRVTAACGRVAALAVELRAGDAADEAGGRAVVVELAGAGEERVLDLPHGLLAADAELEVLFLYPVSACAEGGQGAGRTVMESQYL